MNPHRTLIIVLFAIILLSASCGNESARDDRQPENPNQQSETSDGKTEGNSPSDPEELPLYEWEYPSTRER